MALAKDEGSQTVGVCQEPIRRNILIRSFAEYISYFMIHTYICFCTEVL